VRVFRPNLLKLGIIILEHKVRQEYHFHKLINLFGQGILLTQAKAAFLIGQALLFVALSEANKALVPIAPALAIDHEELSEGQLVQDLHFLLFLRLDVFGIEFHLVVLGVRRWV
jgi:hypothetical protein